jgi:LuxR family transcriptional regulator, maltose regulon positive regulatory protein
MHLPVILVSASAGFGKTSLVTEWIRRRPNLRAGWLSLEASDNEWVRFFRYLVTAWQQVCPKAGETALAELNAGPMLNPEPLINDLLNDLLAEQKGDLLLVLDDYHRVEQPAIHETITYLVEHLPPHCHLVLVTRTAPPLPLARWRLRRAMLEVRADDLRFTMAETAAYLNQTMQLNLAAEQVATLEARTEGWIVGLQLAAVALERCDDAQKFVRAYLWRQPPLRARLLAGRGDESAARGYAEVPSFNSAARPVQWPVM